MAKSDIKITSGSKDRVPEAADVYQYAFEDDPVITYFICKLSREERHAALYKFFEKLLTAAALNDGIISEASDWRSCMFLMPPGKRVDNTWTLIPAGLLGALVTLGFRGCYRMLFEYVPLADAAKAKGLKGVKDYYYVFFVGTRPEAEGQGLASALIRSAQAKAQEAGVPLWLEATTERSAKLYEKLGFETIDVMALGKGHSDADGVEKKGGNGVPVWAMVWLPQQKGSK